MKAKVYTTMEPARVTLQIFLATFLLFTGRRGVRARPLARELFAVATARTSVLYLCSYHSCRRSSGGAGLHWSDRWEGLSCVV